jgi:hypothetical protein
MAKFTVENAAEMGRKSARLRFEREEQARQTIETLVQDPSTDYQDKCLARTRGQLDLVAKAITDELERPRLDSRKLRDLTDAQTRLSEQERILAGRPLPGSHRPTPAKPAKPVKQVQGTIRPAEPQPVASPAQSQSASMPEPAV